MDRIVVIGSPGAGKSTFARKLGDILSIDVYHLDYYFWESGWHEKPRSSRIEIQNKLIHQNERWIIEGTYLSSSDERLNAADTIIFLDRFLVLCFWRVIMRRIEYRNKPRPDLPEGCPEKLKLPYILKVLVFPIRGRRLFFKKMKIIEELQRHEKKKTEFYRFKSNRDAEVFLENLPGHRRPQPAFLEKEPQQAFLPKVAGVTWGLLGILMYGLATLSLSLPFAIIHPRTTWEQIKPHRLQ